MKIIRTIATIVAIALGSHAVGFAHRIAPTPTPTPTPLTLAFQPKPGELHEVVTEWVETENDPRTNLAFGDRLFNIPTAAGQTITARKINSLWRVLDRDAKGNTVIEISYKYIRSARSFGRTVDAWANFLVKDKGVVVVWDTRRKTSEINPDFASLEELPKTEKVNFFIRYLRDIEAARQALANYLIDRPFRIVVDKQGRVLEVQDMDLLLDQYRTEVAKLTPEFETRAKVDGLVNGFLGEEAVRQSLTVTQLLPYPATPVAIGQKWSDSYEFTLLGRKVPVARELSVVEAYPESYELSGKTSFTMSSSVNEKDLTLVGTAEMSTNVDPQTGMFYELRQKGSFRRPQTTQPNQASVTQDDVLMRYDETTKFSLIATRSTNDRGKWRFVCYGGYEEFYILLGEHWYREPNESDSNSSGFIDSQGGASITSVILGKLDGGVPQRNEDIPAYLEGYAKVPQLPVKTSTLKTLKKFRAGSVDWYRARLDISYEAGFVEHLIVQGGFGLDGDRFYAFILRGWGVDFERKLAEGTTALDSIEVRTH